MFCNKSHKKKKNATKKKRFFNFVSLHHGSSFMTQKAVDFFKKSLHSAQFNFAYLIMLIISKYVNGFIYKEKHDFVSVSLCYFL